MVCSRVMNDCIVLSFSRKPREQVSNAVIYFTPIGFKIEKVYLVTEKINLFKKLTKAWSPSTSNGFVFCSDPLKTNDVPNDRDAL